MMIPGPPDPPTRHMWGVGGAGPGVSAEEYARRKAAETQQVCACRVHEPGEECGMVVCWKCEQPIADADPLTANIVMVLQRDLAEARAEAQAISAQSTSDTQKFIEADRLASHYLAEAQRRHQALNCIHAFLADIETSSLSMVEVKEIVRQWCDEANGYADEVPG